jgi:Eco57I restriction-modification methylase
MAACLMYTHLKVVVFVQPIERSPPYPPPPPSSSAATVSAPSLAFLNIGGDNRIEIPDRAFERVFAFFDAWDWRLDDRPLRNESEINPDVLGYIFEKYVNQKQMGAYYTKEDITEYISKNTIIPFLFDRAQKLCANAFDARDGIWKLLREQPDRYIYNAVKHGITVDALETPPRRLDEPIALPPVIAAGLDDVSKRTEWNKTAPAEYGLPTETWREVMARRKRYEEVRAKLLAGEVTQINDLITLNLDIRQFAQDVLATYEGSDLIAAFYRAIAGRVPEKSNEEFEQGLSVLDPTCGSGAFLFAALNVLEPLVETCIERMRSFVEEAEQQGRTTAHRAFRRVLTEMAKHLNVEYFILKSIIIGNLYGVDIIEEATEICKLRLFLKLVAHIDRDDRRENMGLEPLPDIDFNIRAGNTLVGFASLDEVKSALAARLDFSAGETLRQIEEDAREADRAYKRFRQIQTVYDYKDATQFEFKRELRRRLNVLAEKLNCYLAEIYGKDPHKRKEFETWRRSHQPFHWITEFYGIVTSGGFDVIIGNPPYVERRIIQSQYRIKGYSTDTTNNLYAYATERATKLLREGAFFGFIVPLSSMSTDKFEPLQKLVRKQEEVWLSNFDDRPSRLFDGLEHIQLTIIIFKRASARSQQSNVFTTRCYKWSAAERSELFLTISYVKLHQLNLNGSVEKAGSEHEVAVLDKIWNSKSSLGSHTSTAGGHTIYYTRKVHAFLNILDFVPEIRTSTGKKRDPSEQKTLNFDTEQKAQAALSVLNSTLFRWFLTTYSDCRNLNRREVLSFPIDLSALIQKHGKTLSLLTNKLSSSLLETSEIRAMRFGGETLKVQCIIPKHSKPIIDKIDSVLAAHYGFTDEELDFIINYDIKYRMGRDAEESNG